MPNIGEMIRNARKEKGMTQDALAEILHVTRASVSNWEVGRRLPDVETLMTLSKVLGISLDSQQEEQADSKEDSRPERKAKLTRLYAICAAAVVCLALCTVWIVAALQPKPQKRAYKDPEGEIYTIENFREEAQNQAGKAYLRVNPQLTVSKGENVDYWMYSFEYHEMNGVALEIDRIETVYFAKEKENAEMILTAADIRAYGLDTKIAAYGDWTFTSGLPVQDTMWGVGVLMRCTDEHGEKLSFTGYTPFAET